MKHGDISNTQSFVIGVRCEDTLLLPKESTLFNRVANLFHNKYESAEINKEVSSLMRYIFWETEMTVVLVVNKENYTDKLLKHLDDIPYAQVKNVITNVSEITRMLLNGELTYFITNDSIEKSLVNSQYAMSFGDFNTLLKRSVKRFD